MTAGFTPVVEHPDEVSAAWMSTALSAAGRPVRIAALGYERIGTGQTGACYRFHLEHADDAPRTVILKTAAGSPEQRARVRRGYRAEVFFYQQLLQRAKIHTPRCWHAAISDDALTFALLLSDAAPAVPGAQERGCGEDEAADALRNLAGLHAAFWNSPILAEEAAWLAMEPARAEVLARTHAVATDQFLTRYAAELSAEEAEVLRRATALIHGWLLAGEGPRTVLHGDYRLDNLLFPPHGAGPVLAVDWQTLDVGLPGRDLAYFLATALESEDRRRLETSLLQAYHDQLRAHGLQGYSLEACRLDYRRGMLQAPFITMIGCFLATGERSAAADRMFLSMARRAIHAIQDLEVLELLEAASA